MTFWELFPSEPALIGVVHLLPLPGSPRWGGDWEGVERRAVAEACALAESGANGVLVENFGDVPFYPHRVEPITVAAMSVLTRVVHDSVGSHVRVGVNVLRNDAIAALSVAVASGASFIRVNVHTGVMVADQGVIEGQAASSLRERARLRADVALFADVWVKHAVPLGDGATLERAAEDTFRRGLADALIVTGVGTGSPTSPDDVRRVCDAVPEAPVIVGSGVDESNVSTVLSNAHGIIVGTHLKEDGDVRRPVDLNRARRLFHNARRATFSNRTVRSECRDDTRTEAIG
jgi:hypothetical protein